MEKGLKNISIIYNKENMENTNEIKVVKPFIKWAGSKRANTHQIIANFPQKMNNYHEVFLGGGSVLLAFLSYVKQNLIFVRDKIYAYDKNLVLINAYKNIQENPTELYEKIKELTLEYMRLYRQSIAKVLCNNTKEEINFLNKNWLIDDLREELKQLNELLKDDPAVQKEEEELRKNITEKVRLALGINEILNIIKSTDWEQIQNVVYQNKSWSKDELNTEKERLNKLFNDSIQEEEEEQKLTLCEKYYYDIRSEFNNLPFPDKHSIRGSAMFIFLNQRCYRGLFRATRGRFDINFGLSFPKLIDKDKFMEISKLIKNVKFKCARFENAMSEIKEDDFAYLDPPYMALSNNINKNELDGFNEQSQNQLFQRCEVLKMKKIKYVITLSTVQYKNVSTVKNHFSRDYNKENYGTLISEKIEKAFPSTSYEKLTLAGKRKQGCLHPNKKDDNFIMLIKPKY